MAHAHSNSKSSKGNALFNEGGERDANPSTFHDFLGKKCAPEISGSATSDLGSVNVRGHLEGIPFYGMRSNGAMAGASSSQLMGNKRSNSDSFTSSQDKDRDKDSPLLTKLLRYSAHEDDTLFPKPFPNSRITEAKWGRAASALFPGPLFHNPLRAPQPQTMPFCRLKDTSNVIAADEGSRTGIKRPSLAQISAMPRTETRTQTAGKQIAVASTSEPELTTNLSQMTVFYGGEAHVFDNVPPNKADVIMALAGSSGGSWSTTYNHNLSDTTIKIIDVKEMQLQGMHSSEK